MLRIGAKSNGNNLRKGRNYPGPFLATSSHPPQCQPCTRQKIYPGIITKTPPSKAGFSCRIRPRTLESALNPH